MSLFNFTHDAPSTPDRTFRRIRHASRQLPQYSTIFAHPAATSLSSGGTEAGTEKVHTRFFSFLMRLSSVSVIVMLSDT